MSNITKNLTIIIPAYNCENTIRSCIDSVININNNINILVINDGSTDSTLIKCTKYCTNDCFKIISTKNYGVSHARNIGINNCKTKYLMFLDSDDKLSFQLKNIIENYDTKIDLLKFSFLMENNMKKNIFFENKNYIFPNDYSNFYNRFFASPNYNMVWGQIIKTKILKNNQLRFNENLSFSEDILFNYNLYKKCNFISFKKDIGYLYLNNVNSLTRNKNINTVKKRLIDSIKVFENIYNQETIINNASILNKAFHEIFPQILSISFYKNNYKEIELIYKEVHNSPSFKFILNNFKFKNLKGKYKYIIYFFIKEKYYYVYLFSKCYKNIKLVKILFEKRGVL